MLTSLRILERSQQLWLFLLESLGSTFRLHDIIFDRLLKLEVLGACHLLLCFQEISSLFMRLPLVQLNWLLAQVKFVVQTVLWPWNFCLEVCWEAPTHFCLLLFLSMDILKNLLKVLLLPYLCFKMSFLCLLLLDSLALTSHDLLQGVLVIRLHQNE